MQALIEKAMPAIRFLLWDLIAPAIGASIILSVWNAIAGG